LTALAAQHRGGYNPATRSGFQVGSGA